MKNVIIKNLALAALIATLGACGSDDNQYGYGNPYLQNGLGGVSNLACPGIAGQKMLGMFVGSLGNGASIGIDLYLGPDNRVAAVGDISIGDLDTFWGSFMGSGSQGFVSCLTSNGFTGSLVKNGGTGAYRDLQITLKGTNISVQMGSNMPYSSGQSTQVAGSNLVGPVHIKMGNASDTFVLLPNN